MVTELRQAPIEGHYHLVRLVEQANAVIGEFYASAGYVIKTKSRDDDVLKGKTIDALSVSNGAEEESDDDDDDLYFAPERGNVIFASAMDGWAFRLSHFARLYAVKLGFREETLRRCLWGEYFLDPKTKRILTRAHAGERALKPMFVHFVLDNIWAVYGCVSLNQ